MKPKVFAIAAHPDDIEFMMSGVPLLLREKGWEFHYMTIGNGSCGSQTLPGPEIAAIRQRESQNAAKTLGASWRPSLKNDLEILYELDTLRRLAATIRAVDPTIVLTHSPEDYMEDHMNTCRLVVTACFARGIPNFETLPPTDTVQRDLAIYHAMPHGLEDGLRRRPAPDWVVDIATVQDRRRDALACHDSQKSWLDQTQGMDSFLKTQEAVAREVGAMTDSITLGEGWLRHAHTGFSQRPFDPLQEALPEFIATPKR